MVIYFPFWLISYGRYDKPKGESTISCFVLENLQHSVIKLGLIGADASPHPQIFKPFDMEAPYILIKSISLIYVTYMCINLLHLSKDTA